MLLKTIYKKKERNIVFMNQSIEESFEEFVSNACFILKSVCVLLASYSKT